MRVIKFFRIDVMRTIRYWYLWLFPLVFTLIFVRKAESLGLFGIAYGLFMGIIFSTMPYNCESQNEIGFLQMLPSRPGEQVLGHFLYGAVILLLNFLSGAAGTVLWDIAYSVRGWRVGAADAGMSWAVPIFFGIALAATGVEGILLATFRFENARAMQLLRMLPALLFFFGAGLLTDFDSDALIKLFKKGSFAVSIPILLVCVALYIAMAWAGRTVAVKRNRA